MTPPFISKNLYQFLFASLGIVYLIGLFVPLMDNDAAHHANIALRMHLTGDYINLIDNGNDYLDKPHLHFWLSALSFKIFGVTTFAYKLPSLLFTIGGVYAVYQLGKILFDNETGKLAALIIASSFAFILANNDVRMDAMITASVAFASWQGIAFINEKKNIHAVGLAMGLAIGFCVKGHIAVLTPLVGLFFYILFKKEFKVFLSWKWLIVVLGFAIFISPVVYCYYLQFNLHPEKIIRGNDNIDGVKFILFNQSIDRFTGAMGGEAKKDYFFFLHSFLWAFAPWSVVCYWAIAERVKNGFKRKYEWFTVSTILILALLLTLSGFKLPHYLNIVFPAASVLVSNWLMANAHKGKIIFRIQLTVIAALLLLTAILNSWLFPIKNYFILPVVILLLAAVFHFIKSVTASYLKKAVCISVFSISVFFFMANSNYFAQLASYQGGNILAKKKNIFSDSANVYFWNQNYSSSFVFYTAELRKQFDSSSLDNKKTCWLLFDDSERKEVLASGYIILRESDAVDFEITRFNLNFYLPSTRKKIVTKMILAEIAKTH